MRGYRYGPFLVAHALRRLAADGAREERPGEAELVRQTREVVAKVDWPCDVRTLFRETNLGCGSAVSSANAMCSA